MANAKSKKWNAHIALAFCKVCRDDMVSQRGGIFVKCRCGESFIDQDRFGGLYIRVGGQAELVEQICPQTCKEHNKRDVKPKNSSASKPKSNKPKKGQVRKAKPRNKRA